MKKSFFIYLILTAGLCFSSLLTAENITFSADRMSGSAKKNASVTVLSGKARIVTEEMEINADKIELSGEDYRNIRAEGNIEGKNIKSGLDFTCSELDYDRDTKLAVLSGEVNLKDTENDVVAKAQVITYNSETDIAVLQIGVNLTQKDNVCTASYAVYHKGTQMLNLSGNAKITQKGDVFRAQQITLNMETEEITLDGRVKGTVSEKEDSAGDSKTEKKQKAPSENKQEETEENKEEKTELKNPVENIFENMAGASLPESETKGVAGGKNE